MWLVLCDAGDVAALWAYGRLVERGLASLELFTAQVLAPALRWEHRVSTNGASIDIETADGRYLRSDDVKGALNRLTWVPDRHLAVGAEADRGYALQELNALFLSWLCAVPGQVLNRPTAGGLSGRWRHPSEWAVLAARAGLRPIPYHQSSEDPPEEAAILRIDDEITQVFVVSDRVVSGRRLPESVIDGCRRLAHLAETTLLGIELVQAGTGRWSFLGASPTPDLRLGGEGLVDALLAAFGP